MIHINSKSKYVIWQNRLTGLWSSTLTAKVPCPHTLWILDRDVWSESGRCLFTCYSWCFQTYLCCGPRVMCTIIAHKLKQLKLDSCFFCFSFPQPNRTFIPYEFYKQILSTNTEFIHMFLFFLSPFSCHPPGFMTTGPVILLKDLNKPPLKPIPSKKTWNRHVQKVNESPLGHVTLVH